MDNCQCLIPSTFSPSVCCNEYRLDGLGTRGLLLCSKLFDRILHGVLVLGSLQNMLSSSIGMSSSDVAANDKVSSDDHVQLSKSQSSERETVVSICDPVTLAVTSEHGSSPSAVKWT